MDQLNEIQNLLGFEEEGEGMLPILFPVEDGSATLAHDGYDAQEWRASLRAYPRLAETVRAAGERLVTAQALFRDLFWSFYKRVPEPRPLVPLTEAHRINAEIVTQVMSTIEWQQVRSAGTAGDVVAAAMATIGVAERALAALPEETIAHINHLHELESGARAMFDQAEALEELAVQAQGDQATALYAQAQQARQEAEAARREIEETTEALDEGEEARADAVRRAARSALGQAEAELDDMQAAAAAFGGGGGYGEGLGSGGSTLTAKEKIALATHVGKSRRLKEIAALCGRLTRIALRVQRSKVQHPPDEVTSISIGSDLAHLLPSEIGLLADPALEELFYLKFAEGRLLQYHLEGSEKQGQGPIVVALDSSGSMREAVGGILKEVWAKAVMLALLAIARRQKRDMAVLHFSSEGELRTFQFPKGQGAYQEVVTCTEFFYGGGTAFEPWMEAALELVDEARFDKADVICISDGLTYIDEAMQRAWQARRQGRGMRSYGVLIGTREGAGVLGSITDALLTLDNLQDDTQVLETIFAV